MPFSITTQDGITIQNIPDNIDPNSDVLRQRVTALREQQPPEAPTEAISPTPQVGGGRSARAQQLAEGRQIRQQELREEPPVIEGQVLEQIRPQEQPVITEEEQRGLLPPTTGLLPAAQIGLEGQLIAPQIQPESAAPQVAPEVPEGEIQIARGPRIDLTPEEIAREQRIIEKSRSITARQAAAERIQRGKIESEELPEIGSAPELNAFSLQALKTSAALLIAGDDRNAAKIINQQIPESTFRVDAGDNIIVDLPSGSFAINKPGLSGQDIAQGITAVLAFTPAGRAAVAPISLIGGVAAGAVTAGLTEAALQEIKEQAGGDASKEAVLLSTALGPIGPVAKSTGQLIRKAITGKPSAAAQDIIDTGKELGVDVLTTDLVQPGAVGQLARQTGEIIPFAGTGGTRAVQEEARKSAIMEFVRSFPTPGADEIFQSLKNNASKFKQAAGKRIEDVTARMNTQGNVSTSNAVAAVDDAIETLELQKIRPDTQTITDLKAIREGLLESQSFEVLRNGRTAIREMAESVDSSIRSQLPSFSKTQVNRVKDAITKDLDSFVRKVEGTDGLAKYKKADQVYAQEARNLTKSRLKNVLDKGDITPEAATTLLFSKKPSEVALMFKSLDTKGRNAARGAFIQNAFNNSFNLADGTLNTVKFTKELKQVIDRGGPFFSGENKKIVTGLERLLGATNRAAEVAKAPLAGRTLGPSIIAGGGLAASPVIALKAIVGAGAVGLAARAYESKLVRNALIRLANAPKGTASEKAINNAASAILPLLKGSQEIIEGAKNEQ